MMHRFKHQRGFTLIEILIALLVFGLGILGITALTSQSQRITHQAYQSMVATWQLHDMMELIRANASEARGSTNYQYSYNATIPTDPNCIDTGCSATEMARYDLLQWINSAANDLPGGEITVSSSTGSYTLTLYWDGDRTGSTATPDPDCDNETTLMCQKLEFEL